MSRGEKIPPGVVVWFQSNGWMDTNLMIKYIDYLNDLRVKNEIRGDSSMLVYDSFRGHLEKSVKQKFYESGIHLAVIPGGLTSVCQPLDVSINKPFKDNLRKEWHTWMASGGAGEIAAGNLRRASFSDVCLWVKRAWEGISTEIIFDSFKKCKISNDLGSDLEVSDDGISDDSNDDDYDFDDDDEIIDDDEVIGEDDIM
jgi:DDE superfamily endonuclease